MTRAQEYLEQIEMLDAMIDEMVAELDVLNSKACKVTASMQDVPVFGGGSGDKVGDGATSLVMLADELTATIDIFADLKREACGMLRQIRKAKYYKVLSMRYFRYMTFQDIAIKMDCSVRNAQKLHGRALQVFDRLLAEKEEQARESV